MGAHEGDPVGVEYFEVQAGVALDDVRGDDEAIRQLIVATERFAASLREIVARGAAARVMEAVEHMAAVLAVTDSGDVFGAMSCREVESIADVLRAGGWDGAATCIIAEHAPSDDVDDAHYLGERCECGASLSDGEGYAGQCGSCADVAACECGGVEDVTGRHGHGCPLFEGDDA